MARPTAKARPRGHSSVGRALALQARGRRFDPGWLHLHKMKPGGWLCSPGSHDGFLNCVRE